MPNLKRVAPGEPLSIPASTFNAFIDAAEDFQSRQRGIHRSARREHPENGEVLVQNATEAMQPRFSVMSIAGVVIGPEDNLSEFKTRAVLTCGTPTGDPDDEPFVILHEPLPAGRIGYASIHGTSVVQIDVSDEDDTTARTKASSTVSLESGDGPAKILWKQSGTGLVWAVVLFPFGAGGGDEAGGATMWGTIVTCDWVSGLATVQRATGTIGGLEASEDDPVEAWNGPYGWHRAGDEVFCVANPDGISPAWTIVDKVAGLGAFDPPDTSEVQEWLTDAPTADNQDGPALDTACEDTI